MGEVVVSALDLHLATICLSLGIALLELNMVVMIHCCPHHLLVVEVPWTNSLTDQIVYDPACKQ